MNIKPSIASTMHTWGLNLIILCLQIWGHKQIQNWLQSQSFNRITSSDGNVLALLALCVRNSTVNVEFPSQRPVMQSFDVFFHLCLNKRLSKQSWDWWFEMPSWSLWCHCNVLCSYSLDFYQTDDIIQNAWTDLITSMMNSSAPWRCGSKFKSVIFEHMLRIKFISTFCHIAARWMMQNNFKLR